MKRTMLKQKKQNNISINVIGYKDQISYGIYTSEHTFEKQNSLYVLIKDFNRLMQQNITVKNNSCLY